MNLFHDGEPFTTLGMHTLVDGLNLVEPSIEFNNAFKRSVMVRAVVLTAQFSRHLCNDVHMKGCVRDMKRVLSQERVCQLDIRNPSVEVTRALKVYNAENDVVLPIKGQPCRFELSHKICKREGRKIRRGFNPRQD